MILFGFTQEIARASCYPEMLDCFLLFSVDYFLLLIINSCVIVKILFDHNYAICPKT